MLTNSKNKRNILLMATGAIGMFSAAMSASATPIVLTGSGLGGTGNYSFTYTPFSDLNTSYKFTDAVANDIQWTSEGTNQYAYLNPTALDTVGTITWEFQAAPGAQFSSDASVFSTFVSYSGAASGSYQTAAYSTDGTHFTQFEDFTTISSNSETLFTPTDPLASYGYTGSNTLYIRYTMYVAAGTPPPGSNNNNIQEQLFRSINSTPTFEVSGTASAIPEPTTLALLASAGAGLLLMAPRKRA